MYFVGPNQAYATANEALNSIASALQGGDFELPPETLDDGGQVNIIFRGGGLHAPIKVPDDLTLPLLENNRFLIFRRLEFYESGEPIEENLPIISPEASTAKELEIENRVIGINLGQNNPNIKIRGIRVEKFVIGIRAGFNCHNLYIDRNFVTNCSNCQIYIHDVENLYVTNNLCIGGEYGLVMKFCKSIRSYHNTIFLDGLTARGGTAKAGMVLQGERLFNATQGTGYSLGNLVFTIGCPSVIYYDEDLKNGKLISDYNDFFSIGNSIVQLRQDNAQFPSEEEVVEADFYTMLEWRNAGPLGAITNEFGQQVSIDAHSISAHPIFIQALRGTAFASTSIIDLTSIGNSPIMEKVPSWYSETVPDTDYIPSDFDVNIISKDSLLNTRQVPTTAIGANDAPSVNGFFGQDIFTSPLLVDPGKTCDVDPLLSVARQNIDMVYPRINKGYFYSHERKYYLYAKKGAYQLGFLLKSTFVLPSIIDISKGIEIKVRGLDVSEENWDLAGQELSIYHIENGVSNYSDTVEIEGHIRKWGEDAFNFQKVYYSFKISDGQIEFVLPRTYVPSGPVVITDDRIAYRDPIDIIQREFTLEFDKSNQETKIVFLGTDNHIDNPQFDVSPEGRYPSMWRPKNGTSIFMLGPDYAYVGERALALGIGTGIGGPGRFIPDGEAGEVTSSDVSIRSGEYLTWSWHSRLPIGITGVSNVLRTVDVDYAIKYYDHNDNLLLNSNGSFTVENHRFNKYYLTYGDKDALINENIHYPTSAYMTGLYDTAISVPDRVAYGNITFTAPTLNYYDPNAFIIIDGAMAEKNNVPSPYHQQPSFEHMTVEFETSDETYFVDKRMNISPVFNEDPNGFLYIVDMPAKIWDGPDDYEVTTLHEYRWPEGRLLHLPWSRMYGKDKLKYRSSESLEQGEPVDIIEPFEPPKRAVTATMSPHTVRTIQDSDYFDGLSVEILDNAGNPFGLRSFVLNLIDPKNNFPGYLAKRRFGAKEQLGSTVFGKLTEHGSANVYYNAPPSNIIRYVGDTPSILNPFGPISGQTDAISFIKTPYHVALENNGNITVIGQSGFLSTEGTSIISGQYFAINDGTRAVYVDIEYPPVFGSVSAVMDGTRFKETYVRPTTNEFLVDYPNSQLVFAGGTPTDVPIEVSYFPKYVYPDPQKPDTVVFHHHQVFGTYAGPIQVDYDAQLYLEVNIQNPLTGEFVNTFSVVAQNPQLANKLNDDLSLEY
jgi:hypothetical protein